GDRWGALFLNDAWMLAFWCARTIGSSAGTPRSSSAVVYRDDSNSGIGLASAWHPWISCLILCPRQRQEWILRVVLGHPRHRLATALAWIPALFNFPRLRLLVSSDTSQKPLGLSLRRRMVRMHPQRERHAEEGTPPVHQLIS
ncbi:hypothetical protein DFH06DRAFT_1208036, partial [Mycena polygramma]